jgi:hypothetical protein
MIVVNQSVVYNCKKKILKTIRERILQRYYYISAVFEKLTLNRFAFNFFVYYVTVNDHN